MPHELQQCCQLEVNSGSVSSATAIVPTLLMFFAALSELLPRADEVTGGGDVFTGVCLFGEGGRQHQIHQAIGHLVGYPPP